MLRMLSVPSGRVGLLVCVSLLLGVSNSSAQLPFYEGFESDGDGTRYTVFDPGFDGVVVGGPGIWDRVAFSTDLTAPISLTTGQPLGLASAAPEKRAAIMWDASLTEDDVDFESWSVWLSLMNWMVDGKENATVAFYPAHDPNTLLPTLVQSLDYTIVDLADSTMLPDPSTIDLLIQTNAATLTNPDDLVDYAVPVIAFDAPNHDDTAITGIGEALIFDSPPLLKILQPNHPALTNDQIPPPGEIVKWTLPATLQGLGKAHGGGKVLASVENPLTGLDQPALFVIEKGDGLLGTFDPNPEGDFYFAGAALNKFGTAGERQLTFPPIDVSGAENVKLTVSLAATDADFETSDYLRVQIDTQGTGTFELLAEYAGVTEPANTKGALVDTVTGHILTSNEFQDRVFDIPDGTQSITLRFDALNTFGNEIVGIDNIRISSAVSGAGCDFDGDGVCGVADLDALLYGGQQSQNLTYDINGDGSVDLADRDEWLSQAGTKESGQTYPLGDFNFSNKTDAGDLNVLGLVWQQSVSSYANGDTNGDGIANAGDLNVVGIHWQESGTAAAATAAVPESSLSWFAVLGCLAFVRRWIRR